MANPEVRGTTLGPSWNHRQTYALDATSSGIKQAAVSDFVSVMEIQNESDTDIGFAYLADENAAIPDLADMTTIYAAGSADGPNVKLLGMGPRQYFALRHAGSGDKTVKILEY